MNKWRLPYRKVVEGSLSGLQGLGDQVRGLSSIGWLAPSRVPWDWGSSQNSSTKTWVVWGKLGVGDWPPNQTMITIPTSIFGRTDAEAEAVILWPPDAKSWFFGKVPAAGKSWEQEEKGVTQDEMIGWHHWLNGHEFEQTQGASEGKGSLASCSAWGRKESDVT